MMFWNAFCWLARFGMTCKACKVNRREIEIDELYYIAHQPIKKQKQTIRFIYFHIIIIIIVEKLNQAPVFWLFFFCDSSAFEFEP